MNQHNQKEPKDYLALLFIASAGVVVTVLFFNWYFLHYRGADTRGTAGDMFGVSTSLFSGLGFAAIVITLYMQRRQILDAQKTSNDQLDELVKQRRLSVMPAFVIRPSDTRGDRPELVNIGNGTAVNIRLDNFGVT